MCLLLQCSMDQHHFSGMSEKSEEPETNEKTSGKKKTRAILQINWLVFSKNVMKAELRNCSRSKETKET